MRKSELFGEPSHLIDCTTRHDVNYSELKPKPQSKETLINSIHFTMFLDRSSLLLKFVLLRILMFLICRLL